MSKRPKADRTHPEWIAASLAFHRELHLPRAGIPVRHLLDPSLVRIYMRYWLEQERVDPAIIYHPFDEGNDPVWFQHDGLDASAGTPQHVIERKWRRRADLFFNFYGSDVWHVVDWLVVANQDGHPWLANVDERGDRKKLTKCMTLADLVREANKALRHRNEQEKVVLGRDEEDFVMDLGVGHTLVRLRSLKALRHEGDRMHHCVGLGSYDSRLATEGWRFLSVRDPDGKPLATLELNKDVVRQFRGPRNSNPSPAVVDLISTVADNLGWQGLLEAADGRYSPYGRDARHVLEDLPPVRRRLE